MSGMTIAEKVLSRKAGRGGCHPGEIIDARIDVICINEQFERLHKHMVEAGFAKGLPRIAEPEKVHLLLDHYQPALNAAQARRQDALRELVGHYGITNFTDSICGVIHRIVMETVLLPGQLGLCNDSHGTAWGAINCLGTGLGEHDIAFALIFGELWFKVPDTTRIVMSGELQDAVCSKDVMLSLAAAEGEDFALYRSLEFAGEGVAGLSMDSRMAFASHAVEVGAKFGLFDYDDVTEAFLAKWRPDADTDFRALSVASDPDAFFAAEIGVDLSAVEPHVATPSRFGNAAPLAASAGTPITQAVIGSCANGMFEDIAVAAQMLKGRRVAPGTRFFVQPASWGVYREVMRANLVEPLLDAGAQIIQPGCHLCQGRQAHLSARDTCITSTTRNHRGRMGEPEADVYLAGPATVAAAALTGRITDPREVWA